MSVFRFIATMIITASMAGVNIVVAASGGPNRPEPERVKWKARSIVLAVSSSVLQPNSNFKPDSDVAGAIRRSVDAWRMVSDLDIQVEFSDRQSISASGNAGDGVSLLTVAQTPENVLLFSRNPQGESAKTRVFYNKRGNITEADIVLNPFEQFSTDGAFGTFDLEATIKHEIGHVLGLQHSAVLGSVMSDSIPRNGATGETRINSDLSDSDVAAVRELYGGSDNDGNCCSAIIGRIAGDRNTKNMRVWAEEAETGRVMSQAKVGADGSFRIGGLNSGSYTLNWQRSDADGKSAGMLTTIKLGKNETKTITEKIGATRANIALDMIGSFGQLCDSVYRVRPGREYTVLVGGKQLDADSCWIEFSSPLIRLRPGSISAEEFEGDVTALRFAVSIDEKLQPGAYTVYVTGGGSRSPLIGAIRVN